MNSGYARIGLEFRGGWYNAAHDTRGNYLRIAITADGTATAPPGEFANTYGLRRFRLDESKKRLSFEYDASRLRETQVAHALGQARIAVARKVN